MSDQTVSTLHGTELARTFVEEAWGAKNLDAYDKYNHRDVVLHLAGYTEPFRGLEAVKGWVAAYWHGFPDVEVTIEETVEQGDSIMLRWTGRATHTGTYLGIPATGRRVTITALQLFHRRGDKFAETWIMFDPLGVLQQLRVFPTGTPPRPVVVLLKTLTRLSRLRRSPSHGG